jgi:hypothetical protein
MTNIVDIVPRARKAVIEISLSYISGIRLHVLGFQQEDWTQTIQNRVVKILTHLGFAHYRARTAKGREYRYRREPIAKKK